MSRDTGAGGSWRRTASWSDAGSRLPQLSHQPSRISGSDTTELQAWQWKLSLADAMKPLLRAASWNQRDVGIVAAGRRWEGPAMIRRSRANNLTGTSRTWTGHVVLRLVAE